MAYVPKFHITPVSAHCHHQGKPAQHNNKRKKTHFNNVTVYNAKSNQGHTRMKKIDCFYI